MWRASYFSKLEPDLRVSYSKSFLAKENGTKIFIFLSWIQHDQTQMEWHTEHN